MHIKKLTLAVSLITATVMTGCGSSSSSSTPVQSQPQNQIKTGQFIDSAVAGLSYKTETQSGTTDTEGRFSYLDEETVVFSIGELDLPEVKAGQTVTPLNIMQTTSLHDGRVQNLARLLQTLDEDENPDNGITIQSDLLSGGSTFENWGDETAVSDLIGKELVSRGKAFEHLSASMQALENHASMTLVGRYSAGQAFEEDVSRAEIVDFHKTSKSILVINAEDNTVDILNASGLTEEVLINPKSSSNLLRRSQLNVGADVQTITAGGVNSVAVSGGLMAVAVENNVKTDPGVIAFYTLSETGEASFLKEVAAGALPDNVVFSPDGKYAIAANEGEPTKDYTIDPEGSVTIIPVVEGVPANSGIQVSFAEFNKGEGRNNELSSDVRISHPEASVAQDLEPEYVTVSEDSKTAFVSMQENNAIASIDLDTQYVKAIWGLGAKDHGLDGNGFDASNKDDVTNIVPHANVFGLYMPDTIAAVSINGTDYILTANEGDSREYEGGDAKYVDEERVEKLTLDANVFSNPDELQQDEALGRLKVLTTQGDTDNNGEFEQLYSFGARSFSIFNGQSGELVFDSGDDFEQITALTLGENFNSNNDENSSGDSRSDDKGPEPEALAVGQVNDKTYAFIGLERTGGIMMYDITDPTEPDFVEYTINRDFSVDLENDLQSAGDLAPEGMKFVAAADSPSGNALLIVGNEVSGSTTVYQIK
ncbi:alkaline phosphatase [Endozoicomonas sp. OPT23]|uniref:choice-of-anchor I family protein n=1 Tax=Endozoicomonas sp. OPT23 TaxID=2072845 RepID=UPI00129B11A7|nr:choice-of-anchor I family protein [Endozoicomonas sp. OPT23]MRI33244.1 alkaline phosphatase [Endozoicomonas sp. OPT23]